MSALQSRKLSTAVQLAPGRCAPRCTSPGAMPWPEWAGDRASAAWYVGEHGSRLSSAPRWARRDRAVVLSAVAQYGLSLECAGEIVERSQCIRGKS